MLNKNYFYLDVNRHIINNKISCTSKMFFFKTTKFVSREWFCLAPHEICDGSIGYSFYYDYEDFSTFKF